MLYTVSICLLVALLLAGMVLLFGYARLGNDAIYFKELAQDNLESGKNLVLYGNYPDFGQYQGSLFHSRIDSYHVETRPWGVYGLLLAHGVHGPAHKKQALLYGARPQGIFNAALFLEDRKRPLILAGKTYIQGTLYLPQAGIKRGYIGRTGFQGKSLYHGKPNASAHQHTRATYARCQDIAQRLRRIKAAAPHGAWQMRPGDSLVGDWQSPPWEILSTHPIHLGNLALKGNIVVTAPHVYISREARLQDILIVANGIHVQSGFKGRLQLFATDSIFIEPQCTLHYPSAVALGSTDEFGTLFLGDQSRLEGLLLSDAALVQPGARTESITTIAPEAEVVGTAMVAENLDLKGTVTGTLITGKFRLLTSAAVYDNHLLDATIRSEGLSPRYAMPLLQEDPQQFLEILTLSYP